jgi:hypothetical protein
LQVKNPIAKISHLGSILSFIKELCMTRNIFIFLLFFFCLPAFSVTPGPLCNQHASIASAPDFCVTFPPAAECNCNNMTHNPDFCKSMTNIYKMMISTYGSLDGACKMQNITDPAECVADWNCYWDGGVSSKDHKPCDANGIRCTTDPRPPG